MTFRESLTKDLRLGIFFMTFLPPKVLVVDDERDFLSSMQSVLEVEGYSVLTAENGNDALQILDEQKPDLVLTDLVMPDLSGMQLAKRIRERVDIPIISMTGYAFKDDISHGNNKLVDLYLTKPLQITDLLAALTICLDRRFGVEELS